MRREGRSERGGETAGGRGVISTKRKARTGTLALRVERKKNQETGRRGQEFGRNRGGL